MIHLPKTNFDEDRVSDLFFQLSNADRRRIVQELQKENLKLNEVAKRLDITATEAFRQLQRLTDAGFLEKVPDGKYRSTPYAQLILDSSVPLDFISRNREYFMDHDASLMPPEFRARLGELSKTVLMTEPVPNMNKLTEMFKSAEKHIEVMVEQGLELHGQIMRQRLLEGVRVRYLMEEGMLATTREVLLSVKQLPEMKSISKICAIIILTDKAVGVGLPRIDGKMDYVGFMGNDPAAIKWASELFENQWEKARPWRP